MKKACHAEIPTKPNLTIIIQFETCSLSDVCFVCLILWWLAWPYPTKFVT